MVLVLAISSLKRSDRTTVLLGGVAWTFGDLGRIDYSEIVIVMAVTVFSIWTVYAPRWRFNAMDMGEGTARSLGIDTKLLRNASILIAALNTGVSVAFVGIIGFVGILAPAMVKRVIGEDKRFMIPATLLMGAPIVLVGDALVRTVAAPLVLPVGAITAALGAPVFVYILLMER